MVQLPENCCKLAITGHFDPAVSKQLKQLALSQDTTVQALLSEALNDLFSKYGQKPIA
ncbi:MAG: ribbon-helix-helix domain-containing protein [Nostoc sp.]